MNIRSVTALPLALVAFIWISGCSDAQPAQGPSPYEQYVASQSGPGATGTQAPGQAAASPSSASRPAAMPKLDDKSTLGDYLLYAAMNNPGLEAQFHRWKAALETIPQATSLADPQFTYRYYIVAQAQRDGDMRNTFEIAQALPFFGKLQLKGDMAAQDAQAAYCKFEAQRLALYYQLKQAYYEYCYLARATAITEENLRQLQDIEQIAQARYKTSSGSQPDVIRAQVEVGKMENELASLHDLQAPTVAKLNAVLSRPSSAPLPAPPQIEVREFKADDEQLLAWMSQANPELKSMDADILRQKAAIELAKKDYFPDLMVGFEYDQMFQAAGVEEGPTNPIALTFSINMPIWWEKYAAEVREARERHWAALKDKADKGNSLGADLKMAAYNFRNAERKIRLYRDTLLPKARQAMKSTQAAYQSGTAGFSDLIDSQRILLEFDLSYERALADRQQGLALLEMLVGKPISSISDEPAGQRPAATTAPAAAVSK